MGRQKRGITVIPTDPVFLIWTIQYLLIEVTGHFKITFPNIHMDKYIAWTGLPTMDYEYYPTYATYMLKVICFHTVDIMLGGFFTSFLLHLQ